MRRSTFWCAYIVLLVAMLLMIQCAFSQDEWEEDDTGDYWTEPDEDEDYYDEDSYYYEEDEEEGYEEDYMGPECYDPDGLCTSTRIGNIRYGYDGTSSQRVGKRTYHSNGVVCTTIRNTTYCEE